MRRADYGLLTTVGILLVFGLVMLASASGPSAWQRFGDSYHFVKRQFLLGIIPGLAVFFLVTKIPLERLRRAAPFFLPAAIVLLLLGFIPGLAANYGQGSWIQLAGLSFQPSEVAKLLLAGYFAWWLKRRSDGLIGQFWAGLIPFVITIGAVLGIMMLQSDLGTTLVIFAMLFAMYVVAGPPASHIAALVAAGLAGIVFFIKTVPYRAERLKIFLWPDLDPQGIGYHINQAFLAIGSGGWFGLGLGKSRQKFLYLPEVSADSIFAVISEELGFLVAAALVAAFAYFCWRGFKIAERAGDEFTRYLAVGITTWIGFQAFINISAMIGLLPLTGVPLPFISHGGSAMVSNLAAVGILAAISRGEPAAVRPGMRETR
jgi:cell division protein FtsW